jgi:hypothetical protein
MIRFGKEVVVPGGVRGANPAPLISLSLKESSSREWLLLFYRILAQNPFIPATLEYCYILEPCDYELLRHTGASSLVGSGAV